MGEVLEALRVHQTHLVEKDGRVTNLLQARLKVFNLQIFLLFLPLEIVWIHLILINVLLNIFGVILLTEKKNNGVNIELVLDFVNLFEFKGREKERKFAKKRRFKFVNFLTLYAAIH